MLTAHPLWLRTRRRRLGGAVSGSNSTQAAALRLVPAKLKLTLNWCAHAPLAFQIWKTVCMHTGVHSRQLVEIFRTRSCVLEHLSRIPARRARRTASAGGEGNLKKKSFLLASPQPVVVDSVRRARHAGQRGRGFQGGTHPIAWLATSFQGKTVGKLGGLSLY